MFCENESDTDKETVKDNEFRFYEIEKQIGGGLFLNLYKDLLLNKQPELRKIHLIS